MTTQATGNRRLLKLADYLETVKPKKFRMNNWLSKDSGGWFSPTELPPGVYDEKTEVIKQVPTTINECGFAACAVGHACAIKGFRRAGLRLSKMDDRGFEPSLKSGETGWNAVEEFFGLPENGWGGGPAGDLFGSDAYGREDVRPKTVAKRIRTFVADRVKKAQK